MDSHSQFPDLTKLWERCRLVYSNIELIGDQLKSQYDSFNVTYHNLCRYFSKFSNRNPTEIHDLVDINSSRLKHITATSQVFLQEIDYKNVEKIIQIFNSLQDLHNFLTGDIMRILARDHSSYFSQSSHNRRFNKILRCVHDVRLALESLNAVQESGKFFKSDSSLPPHEKMWYLFCLVKRESLAVCSILESVGSWEKGNNVNQLDDVTFPAVHNKFPRVCKNRKSKPLKDSDESWETNLRKYKKPVHDDKNITSIINHLSSEYTPSEESIVNESLRINKWNLREPPQTSRVIKPTYNKAFSLRYKNAVSKPHGMIQPYLAKVSVGSDISQVDSLSSRKSRLRRTTTQDQHFSDSIRDFNTKLASLEDVVNQLIAERQQLEHRLIDPLRQQVQQGLEWLKTLYTTKTNAIELTQGRINQLKMEKSLLFHERRKHRLL